MNNRRVVITGLGTICPIGSNLKDFWSNLTAGKTGIGLIERFDTTDYPTKIAAEVKDFNAKEYMPRTEARRMDLFIQYACAGTRLALEDANLNSDKFDPNRTGVLVGAGVGGLEALEKQHSILQKKGVGGISPFFIPMFIPNMASGQISIMFGARGPSSCSVTACATATNSIGDAFKLIQNNSVDVMICGGTEAPITPLSIAGFCSMKALSTRNDEPEKACRPFDVDRDGFVMGEGSAVFIIEELEHALNRGAQIYAEIIGYGSSSDANHMVQPDPEGEGAARAMTMALNDANLNPEDVNYINAHGTGTHFNDIVETKAIKTVFKEHSYNMAISSTKAATGHMMGAAGAIELLATVLSCKNDLVPPTLNLDNPDPECDLNYVKNESKQTSITSAISQSLGFGGHNAVVAIKKFVQ
ncbi:3-oxoacyl-[acyl-carrier-protein] synthase, KASII [Candidatus Syntrophocurvum alkaliphilum]|uniref:3-oxoacyl-[acyl-carrier-protein] synthase 2 n=1 Tax=Candidatus Syntrophocurvum alkaliphilum TaxID=2293317 RepID=A0A6I6DDU6_9FIRM|nr:beta-ketoacyl-ACP synthase II [Candidatus Syntrophocurvum alkaliphilum]QGT98711.1 3-oxoacyl-[acyl-carrier-protein] synthase, KASII [Candidatus Syntrophocurvum alkaliphilum]